MIDPTLLEVTYSTIESESFVTSFWFLLFASLILLVVVLLTYEYIESDFVGEILEFSLRSVFVFFIIMLFVGVPVLIMGGPGGILPSTQVVDYSLDEQPSPEHIEITDINKNNLEYNKLNEDVSFVLFYTDDGKVYDASSDVLYIPSHVDFLDKDYKITVHDQQGNVLDAGVVNMVSSERDIGFIGMITYGLNRGKVAFLLIALMSLAGGALVFNTTYDNEDVEEKEN